MPNRGGDRVSSCSADIRYDGDRLAGVRIDDDEPVADRRYSRRGKSGTLGAMAAS